MKNKEINFIKNYNEDIKEVLKKYSNFQKLDDEEKKSIVEEIKNISLLSRRELTNNAATSEFYKIMELLHQLKYELNYKTLPEFIGYIQGIYKTSLILGVEK